LFSLSILSIKSSKLSSVFDSDILYVTNSISMIDFYFAVFMARLCRKLCFDFFCFYQLCSGCARIGSVCMVQV